MDLRHLHTLADAVARAHGAGDLLFAASLLDAYAAAGVADQVEAILDSRSDALHAAAIEVTA